MFELSFAELLVILIVALVILGPEKLPQFARFIAGIINKIRGLSQNIQNEFTRQGQEGGLDKLGETFSNNISDLRQQVKDGLSSLHPDFARSQDKAKADNPVSPPPEETYFSLPPAVFSDLRHKRRQRQTKITPPLKSRRALSKTRGRCR